MNLPNDVSRCMGQWKQGGPCQKRDECERYTQRETGGHRTPYSDSLCPGRDNYYQFFIPVVAV